MATDSKKCYRIKLQYLHQCEDCTSKCDRQGKRFSFYPQLCTIAQKGLGPLCDAYERVISDKRIILIIDYPLTKRAFFTKESDHGFTRGEIVQWIADSYAKIYREEEEVSKPVPIEQRGPLLNRPRTYGPWGIWGHDFSDLVLGGLSYDNGQVIIEINS